MKVSDSLDNVPNENVVTTGDQQTDRQSDQLLELLEWLFATKNVSQYDRNGFVKNLTSLNTGRALHGCAQFTDNGVNVSLNNSTAFHINTVRSSWSLGVLTLITIPSPLLRS